MVKKENPNGRIMGILAGVFITILILFFIFHVVPNLDKSKLKIYKKECINGTIYNESECVYIDNVCIQKQCYVDDNTNITQLKECIKHLYPEVELCQKVEVNEIEMKDYLYSYYKKDYESANESWKNPQGYIDYCPNKDNEKDCCYNYQKISKQDLTIEWLDENCEGIKEVIRGDVTAWCNEFNEIGDCIDWKFYKYKYKDYIIEVLK